MTTQEFSAIINAAQNGDAKAFNAFFKTLSVECKKNLLNYVSTKAEAEEAFSETMYKFWKNFVIEGRPLPETNIKGYIFTMAKYYCINQQKKHKKVVHYDNHSIGEVVDKGKNHNKDSTFFKSEKDFFAEQKLEDKYQEALKKGIQKLRDGCRKIFEFMLKNHTDKPKDIWQPLGYKNVNTLRSVKSECQKALKLKVMVEMEKLMWMERDNSTKF